MKKSINKVVELIGRYYDPKENRDILNRLLIISGVEEEERHGFFSYIEGDYSSPIGLSKNGMWSTFTNNENLFLNVASQLYDEIYDIEKEDLRQILREDGYVYGDNGLFEKDPIVFQLTYNDIEGVLRVNGEKLTTVRFEGENEAIIQHLLKNSNRLWDVNQLRNDENIQIKKSLDDVVKNLKFTGIAKTLFFPRATATLIELRNPIRRSILLEHNLNENLTIEELFPLMFKKDKKGQKGI